MARFLGLDLGSHTVKAVLLDSQMRGFQVRGYAQVRRGEGDKLETLRAALTQLFAENRLQADQVAIALPGSSLATHPLSLPFTDVKRIEATVPFEVEGQLPFDLSEVVYDYQITTQTDKKSELLIGVVRKDELGPVLGLLTELKIDPRVVTHAGIAYQNLLCIPTMFPDAGGAPIAIVDLGHERTSVAIGRVGGPLELARAFSGGGRELTRALANELQLPAPAAEELKETRGAVGPAAEDPESQRIAAALLRGIQPLLRELRPTLKAYAARTHASVERIYLCGGTARLPGLAAQLTDDMSLPVEVLALSDELRQVALPTTGPAAAQPFALAIRAQASGARAPRFNLRRGELAFKGDFDYLREKTGRLAAFAAALLVLFIASSLARNSMLASREKQVDKLLCDTTERVLGQCERNFEKALSMLRGKESPTAALPKVSAVTLLAELTQRLPGDIPITVDQVTVSLDRINARLQTDSYKQVDKITSALKGFKCFKEVKEGNVAKSKDGQKVSFPIDIQVECPDIHTPQG